MKKVWSSKEYEIKWLNFEEDLRFILKNQDEIIKKKKRMIKDYDVVDALIYMTESYLGTDAFEEAFNLDHQGEPCPQPNCKGCGWSSIGPFRQWYYRGIGTP